MAEGELDSRGELVELKSALRDQAIDRNEEHWKESGLMGTLASTCADRDPRKTEIKLEQQPTTNIW